MPLSISIRSATAQDAPEIARVQVASWKSTYADILPARTLAELSVDRMKQMWETQQENPETSILIVEKNKKVVGFAAAGPSRDMEHKSSSAGAEIYAIYLLKEAQGQGAGRQLMQAMARDLHQHGFRSLFLWVLKANPAFHFYKHMGGNAVSTGTVSLGGQDFDEVAIEWPELAEVLTEEIATIGGSETSA